jgi:hypothetical protein
VYFSVCVEKVETQSNEKKKKTRTQKLIENQKRKVTWRGNKSFCKEKLLNQRFPQAGPFVLQHIEHKNHKMRSAHQSLKFRKQSKITTTLTNLQKERPLTIGSESCPLCGEIWGGLLVKLTIFFFSQNSFSTRHTNFYIYIFSLINII